MSNASGQITCQRQSASVAYDALNRVASVVDALGGITSVTYDANGNVLTVTDARGNGTTHTYDAMDRLVGRTDGLGASESFTYDPIGNPTRHTDRKGRVSSFTYDALNRRIAAVYGDSTTNYSYDAAGRIAQATDSVGGTILYQYDTLDRLLSERTELGTIAYQYDALARRTSMTASGQPPVAYGYDAASRLTSIGRAAHLVQFQYDAAGRRTQLVLPNQVSTDYGYDAASRLTALVYRNASGPLGDVSYQYDAAGNRTAVSGSLARTLLPDPVAAAGYDAANRQLSFGDKVMTYDANGNVGSIGEPSGTTTLAWDMRDRLVGVTTPSTSAGWTYDPAGRRVRSRVNQNELAHLYDGHDIVQTHSPEGTTTFLRTLAIDETLARDAAEFYLSDALGSTLALTAADGSLLTRYFYEPFGRTAPDGADSTNPFQFTARENDGAGGMYSYRLRAYSPVLHRFLSEDPLGFFGGINLYRYARNNPLLYVDPLGLDVTAYYYAPAHAGGFEHAAIQVHGYPTYGFYPHPNFRLQSCCKVVPGDIRRDDPSTAAWSITIRTTSAQDQEIARFISQALEAQSQGRRLPYTLFATGALNCAAFVSKALQAGGLQVPLVRIPELMVLTLLRLRLGGELFAVPQ